MDAPHRRRCLWWLAILGLVLCGLDVAAAPALAQGPGSQAAGDMLTHIVSSAGIVFGPILLLVSIGLVALVVILTADLRLGAAAPPAFVDRLGSDIAGRRFQQAFDACRADKSFLASVLAAGMGRLQYGLEAARHAAGNSLESVRASKEQLINYLGTIGTLGPMIGLVGTVFGMIQSFMELSKGGAPRSEELARGISHALVVTLLGVAISVPAIFCYTFFRNRLATISLEVGNVADDLLTRIHHEAQQESEPIPQDTRLAG